MYYTYTTNQEFVIGPIFHTSVWVCVCLCLYTHTHTHTQVHANIHSLTNTPAQNAMTEGGPPNLAKDWVPRTSPASQRNREHTKREEKKRSKESVCGCFHGDGGGCGNVKERARERIRECERATERTRMRARESKREWKWDTKSVKESAAEMHIRRWDASSIERPLLSPLWQSLSKSLLSPFSQFLRLQTQPHIRM